MIVVLSGEGPTDVGKRGDYDPITCDYKWIEGSIPVIIRRLLKEELDLQVVTFKLYCDKELIRETRKSNRHSKGQRRRFSENRGSSDTDSENIKITGHADAARLLVRRAAADGIDYDLIGVYKDSDKAAGTKKDHHNAVKKFEEVVDQIVTGFRSELYDRNNFFPVVPIRILENWLISDSKAIEAVNEKGKVSVTDYKNPEDKWGNEVPDSDHPKILLEKELSKCRSGLNHNEKCVVIAENMDFDVVRKKCFSFSEFYNALSTAYYSTIN